MDITIRKKRVVLKERFVFIGSDFSQLMKKVIKSDTKANNLTMHSTYLGSFGVPSNDAIPC